MAKMPKRNSKGRFTKGGGGRSRKKSGKRRRKTARRGKIAGATAILLL